MSLTLMVISQTWEFVKLKRLSGKVNLNAGELSDIVCQDFFYKKHDILAHW